MNLHLSDKVFLISGGAKGIGEAISRLIAEEGGVPVMIDPSEQEGAALVKEFGQIGAKSLHIRKRLQAPDDSAESVKIALAAFGRIDGIVNNAGANDGIGLEKGSPESFRRSVEANLGHYYDLVHYALPALKASKGSIVNISSKTAVTGQGSTSGYTAAKGAQLSLTREWAVELLPFGIRVNAVIPAEVMTPLYQKWLNTFSNPEEKLEEISSRVPFERRMTKAEEIANAVVFLLSDRSAHTTGQHLFVDGGYTHLDRVL
jgi:L-fucose dehydrogenase